MDMIEIELRISLLIAASLQGTITSEEQEELNLWLQQETQHKIHFEQAYQQQLLQEKLKVYHATDRVALWEKTVSRIKAQNESFAVTPVRRIYPYKLIAIAAAVVLLLGFVSIYYYRQFRLPQGTEAPLVAKDIHPGKDGATLVLADGTTIPVAGMDEGQVTRLPGVTISKTADGQIVYEVTAADANAKGYNTLKTTRGEQIRIRLSDGTLVYLNAESALQYPAQFVQKADRIVTLTGEAYFEVAKDKTRPFVVRSTDQEVKVLGTHFNISSYPNDESTRTTLVEGAVQVNDKILKPNQQSVLKGGRITIREVDVEQAISWKNGYFLFDDEPLYSIMQKIERWYNVEVVYSPEVDKNRLYGGGVSRYDSLSKVLEKLTLTGNIHFKIEGRRIMVMN